MGGQVVKPPDTRHSPAGIPITRFVLQHQSRQLEAGIPREVQCRIVVVAAGKELAHRAQSLSLEEQVRVTGFISRSSHKGGESKLVLHAQVIESSNP
ncbi:MAG: primosomal replication protein N [Gammaproteobacteria bacterium]|nr:primosomal replication protein N [Gammaproteobacteria bacterium]